MEELYLENILNHARTSKTKVSDVWIETAEGYISGVGRNPSCGDKGSIFIKISNDKVEDVRWIGEGCAISQASISMLCDFLAGKSVNELKTVLPGDIYKMLGVQISPARVGCALLSYNALEDFLLKKSLR